MASIVKFKLSSVPDVMTSENRLRDVDESRKNSPSSHLKQIHCMSQVNKENNYTVGQNIYHSMHKWNYLI